MLGSYIVSVVFPLFVHGKNNFVASQHVNYVGKMTPWSYSLNKDNVNNVLVEQS